MILIIIGINIDILRDFYNDFNSLKFIFHFFLKFFIFLKKINRFTSIYGLGESND